MLPSFLVSFVKSLFSALIKTVPQQFRIVSKQDSNNNHIIIQQIVNKSANLKVLYKEKFSSIHDKAC